MEDVSTQLTHYEDPEETPLTSADRSAAVLAAQERHQYRGLFWVTVSQLVTDDERVQLRPLNLPWVSQLEKDWGDKIEAQFHPIHVIACDDYDLPSWDPEDGLGLFSKVQSQQRFVLLDGQHRVEVLKRRISALLRKEALDNFNANPLEYRDVFHDPSAEDIAMAVMEHERCDWLAKVYRPGVC